MVDTQRIFRPIGEKLQEIAEKWQEHRHGRQAPPAPTDEQLREYMQACFDGETGAIQKLGEVYAHAAGEQRINFLRVLATEFGPNEQGIKRAAKAAEEEIEGTGLTTKANNELHKALNSPRNQILEQFKFLPEGCEFLVSMRDVLLKHLKNTKSPEEAASLGGLESDLKRCLDPIFHPGLLHMREIKRRDPDKLFEQIKEASVNNIDSLKDIRTLLRRGGHIYELYHPSMPDTPLAVLYVAFTHGIADNVQDILKAEPVTGKKDTAIFYSIKNTQDGLSGIPFGGYLIKKAVEDIKQKMPGIKQFSTLSPIPEFKDWLMGALQQEGTTLLTLEEQRIIKEFTESDKSAEQALHDVLNTKGWQQDSRVTSIVEPILMRICEHYLLNEKNPRKGREKQAHSSVSHFHLGNGAKVGRINWMGDPSAKGMDQSFGLMVNYIYGDEKEIGANKKRYEQGQVVAAQPLYVLTRDKPPEVPADKQKRKPMDWVRSGLPIAR